MPRIRSQCYIVCCEPDSGGETFGLRENWKKLAKVDKEMSLLLQ